jgi:hypothetical protein
VHRLAYNGDIAARQLAVFQGGLSRTGGNEVSISGFIRVDPPRRRKNSQLAAARREKRIGVSAYRRLQSVINFVETS